MKKVTFWFCLLLFSAQTALAQSNAEGLKTNKVQYVCLNAKSSSLFGPLLSGSMEKANTMSTRNPLKAHFVERARWYCKVTGGEFTETEETKAQ